MTKQQLRDLASLAATAVPVKRVATGARGLTEGEIWRAVRDSQLADVSASDGEHIADRILRRPVPVHVSHLRA